MANYQPENKTLVANRGWVYGADQRGYGRGGRGNFLGNHGGRGNSRRRAIVNHASYTYNPLDLPVPSQDVLNAFEGYQRDPNNQLMRNDANGQLIPIANAPQAWWQAYSRVAYCSLYGRAARHYNIILGNDLGPAYLFAGSEFQSAYNPNLFSPRTLMENPAIILCDRCLAPFQPGINPALFYQNLMDHQNTNDCHINGPDADPQNINMFTNDRIIARDADVSVYAFMGHGNFQTFCENLSFLGHTSMGNTLIEDSIRTTFFVVISRGTIAPINGVARQHDLMGYFTRASLHHNQPFTLNAMMTMPNYRGRGIGTRMISLSYNLLPRGLRAEPEEPLSIGAKRLFQTYWEYIVMKSCYDRFFVRGNHMGEANQRWTVNRISLATGIIAHHVRSTLFNVETFRGVGPNAPPLGNIAQEWWTDFAGNHIVHGEVGAVKHWWRDHSGTVNALKTVERPGSPFIRDPFPFNFLDRANPANDSVAQSWREVENVVLTVSHNQLRAFLDLHRLSGIDPIVGERRNQFLGLRIDGQFVEQADLFPPN